ncbi:MAG: hypothetical protein ACI83O_000563 [Patescibacteria group bacterium]|jgi:hypothetical protein
MKRGAAGSVVVLCLVLLSVSFVSAGFFDWFFPGNDTSITGNVVSTDSESERPQNPVPEPEVPSFQNPPLSCGGVDTYQLEGSANRFNIGDTVGDVIGSDPLDKFDLSNFLADGIYTDDNNDDFDYSQNIALNQDLRYTLFRDAEYQNDGTTLGMRIQDNNHVLNYTLSFRDKPTIYETNPAFDTNPMDNTDIKIMGHEYHILSTNVEGSEIQLLDSTTTVLLNKGETQSVIINEKRYDVSIFEITINDVRLIVNGEVINILKEGETYKLSDDLYIGVKDIQVQDYAEGVKRLEFTIGNGILTLINGQEVQLNGDSVDNLISLIGVSTADEKTQVDEITISWIADNDLFVAGDSVVSMPFFGNLNFSYEGVPRPYIEGFDIEPIGIDLIRFAGINLNTTTEHIDLLYKDTLGIFSQYGESDNQLSLDGTFDKSTDKWTLLSYSDVDNAESYLLRATNFDNINEDVDIQYRDNEIWQTIGLEFVEGENFILGVGDLEITISSIDFTNEIVTFTGATSTNILYTKEGLAIYLNDSLGRDTYNVTFIEEDIDENIALGETAVVTLGLNPDEEVEVLFLSLSESSDSIEYLNSDIFQSVMYSYLATDFRFVNLDQSRLKIQYYGGEVYANFYLTSETVCSASSSSSGGGGGSTSCVPNITCVLDSILCPANGIQIETCTDANSCGVATQKIISCTPNVCSGCITSDDTCVPYGFRLTSTNSLYCDLDGSLKEQIGKDSDGNLGLCENDYECRSNTCSSGQCIEVAEIAAEQSNARRVFYGVLCRFANIFGIQEYNACLLELYGEVPDTSGDEGSTTISNANRVPVPPRSGN